MAIKASVIKEMRTRIENQVAEGFSERDSIIENAMDNAVDEYQEYTSDELEPKVTELTDAAIAAHHKRQARWKRETDCDRLDQAFAELERQGVVARQNFTCCSTCGHYEIGDEIATFRKKKKKSAPVSGYAFYHMQDTESAVEGGGIYIKYDTLSNDEAQKVAVGEAIVAALTAAGLRPEWDGDPNTGVFVNVTWRKRRPAEELDELET